MNKIVLITGASKGIGKALAEKFLQEKYIVIGTSRTGKFEDFSHQNFHPIQLDVTDATSIKNAHKHIFDNFKRIDVLINNAGIGPDLNAPTPELDSFNLTFQVNVTGAVFFTEPLIPLIPNNGIILNISSIMGSISECKSSDSVAYRMSKSALNMYTKILQNRLKNNIKVASIHPGWVKTTIASPLKNGNLTPEQSANNIFDFFSKDFESGTYWNSENKTELLW